MKENKEGAAFNGGSEGMYFDGVWIVRLALQRALATIYLIGFIVALRQFKPLLGENGLQPVPEFLKGLRFSDAPSLFHWLYSDRVLDIVAWTAVVLSGLVMLGFPESGPVWLPTDRSLHPLHTYF
jgi:hypothetical protein